MSAEITVTTTNVGVTLSTGTVTSITAGAGLTGGVITTSGTIAVDFAPNGAGSATQVPSATDSRLSNARTPTAHAASHNVLTGADPVQIEISQVTGLTAALAQTISNSATITAGTGLTGGGLVSGNPTISANIAPSGGGTATQLVGATDSRLSNNRTPTNHASTHGPLGTDPIPAGGLAQTQVANLVTDLAAKINSTRQVIAGVGLTGGGDLSADRTFDVDFAPSGGGGAGQAVEATDSRLTNGRAPTGSAGGDLAGTYPNPTVGKIATYQVDTSAPATGDVWSYSGTQWNHVAQTALSTNAVSLANVPMDLSAPTTGDVLAYSGTQWDHVAPTTLVTLASLANYTAPVLGSVTRTVASRIAESVSVKDFGAVGNGVANDTAAIQSALNSGIKRVYVPEGTYVISSTLVIPNNVELIGAGSGTIIQANSVVGAAITTFNSVFSGTFNRQQKLANLTIAGSCTHAVTWFCTIDSCIESVRVTATCTNGFVVDGSFNCLFQRLSTAVPGSANVSGVCFWAGRDFNANHLDTLNTSNFCAANFRSSKDGIAPISPYTGSTITGHGSTLTNVCCQGGVVGMDLADVNYGAWTINSPYFENCVLPIRLGKLSTLELCRSVTINSAFLIGPATALSHPSGPSVVAIDIDYAVNVTINSTEFGGFGGSGPPATDCVHYARSHKVLINNFYLSTGGIGSLLTNKIKRKAGADSDGGVFVIGEETNAVNSARSHFMLMKAENYAFQHYKMAVDSTGAWVSTSVIPPSYP